jgi:PAS domain S-box-containing protein
MSSGGPSEKNTAPVEELRRQLNVLKAEVTSQQWLLDALESQSAQYRALFELMPGSVVLLDSKGFVRDANPCFCRAMGYSREELVGLHITKITQETLEMVESNIRRMISGETLQREVTNVQKDGNLRIYEVRETAVTLPDGSMNILAVSNDITDRKRADQAKLEAERQFLHPRELGAPAAAAEAVLEINKVTALLLSSIEAAISRLPAGSSAQMNLRDALLAGKRAEELTQKMLGGLGHVRSSMRTDAGVPPATGRVAKGQGVVQKSGDTETRKRNQPHIGD